MKESGWKKILTKWQLWELRQLFPYMAFVDAWIVPLWADLLLPQLLMEPFDTLLIQRRHIEHMHERFWFGKIIFVYIDSTEIFFSKLRSAGLNYNMPSFFTDSYCAGVSNKHCLLTFFIWILPQTLKVDCYIQNLFLYSAYQCWYFMVVCFINSK